MYDYYHQWRIQNVTLGGAWDVDGLTRSHSLCVFLVIFLLKSCFKLMAIEEKNERFWHKSIAPRP